MGDVFALRGCRNCLKYIVSIYFQQKFEMEFSLKACYMVSSALYTYFPCSQDFWKETKSFSLPWRQKDTASCGLQSYQISLHAVKWMGILIDWCGLSVRERALSTEKEQDHCQLLWVFLLTDKDLITDLPFSSIFLVSYHQMLSLGFCFTIWLTNHSGETKHGYGKIHLFCSLKCGLWS